MKLTHALMRKLSPRTRCSFGNWLTHSAHNRSNSAFLSVSKRMFGIGYVAFEPRICSDRGRISSIAIGTSLNRQSVSGMVRTAYYSSHIIEPFVYQHDRERNRCQQYETADEPEPPPHASTWFPSGVNR
jgi:hypothetical protein